MLDAETQAHRATGEKVGEAGRASSTWAVHVGGQIPPLTGGSELQAQVPGRSSMHSQAVTDDWMSGQRQCVCVCVISSRSLRVVNA
jgi:hypothetical protein